MNCTRPTYFLILSFLLSFSFQLKGEGSKQLAPNPTDRIFLYTNTSEYNDFGRYDGATDQRLYIHIANPETEQLFLGFSHPVASGHYPCGGATNVNGFFRIKDPRGRIVYPQIDNINGQILNSTTANITARSQVIAGPQPIAGGSGYIPFIFDPSGLPAGDYYIEFSRISNIPAINNPMAMEWFDLTVATKTANPTTIEGRVFAKNWAFFAPSVSCGTDTTYSWFDQPFNGSFFVYTDQNIVTQVDFNGAGFQPAAFNVVFNDEGTTRTNNVIEDRKSLNDISSSAAQHRIFLNDPDITIYPSGVLGNFALSPKFLACENGTACVEAVMTEPGQIDVLIDIDTASGGFIYDIGSADVLIAFKVIPEPDEEPPYIRCVPWDGFDGFGNKVGGLEDISNVALLTRYTQGIYHFPIYDAEYMLNGFDVTTIRPVPDNGSPKKVYYDDSAIPDSYGTITNQPKQNPFNGCAVPCHIWDNSEFGNDNTINTWFFAREEYVVEVELGGCPINAQNDSIRIPINSFDTIQVLVNDLGTDQLDTTSIDIGFWPKYGTAHFDTTNYVAKYTPNPGYIGRDTFTYVFCYGILPVRSLCDSATVFIDVYPGPENCLNNIDDDGDGLADCNDPDCQLINNVGAINIIRKQQNQFWWILFLLLGLNCPRLQSIHLLEITDS